MDEFIGALPEQQVRAWLQKAIPSETRRLLQEAGEALAAGDSEQAEALLEEAVTLEPANAEAALLLAKLVGVPATRRGLRRCRERPRAAFDQAQAVQRVAGLLLAEAAVELPDDPAREAYVAGVEALAGGDADAALTRLVDSVRRNRGYNDDAARKTLPGAVQRAGRAA